MKTKEILYDTIVTKYNGTTYTHGEITYSNIPPLKHDELELVSAQVVFSLAINKKDSDNFTNELTELVQKYSV